MFDKSAKSVTMESLIRKIIISDVRFYKDDHKYKSVLKHIPAKTGEEAGHTLDTIGQTERQKTMQCVHSIQWTVYLTVKHERASRNQSNHRRAT